MRLTVLKTFTLAALLSACLAAFSSEIKLVELKCDYRSAPLAVDRPDPVLSWRLEGERQGLSQSAFQIRAASTLEQLAAAELWDSGWTRSSSSTGIEYAGKPFASKQRIYWQVRIQDEKGVTSPWSEPSWFEGGLHQDSDWQGARWISCSREQQNEYAPFDVMGDWIAASAAPQTADSITYSYHFELPDKHVVYAGAWWNYPSSGTSELNLNGQRGASFTEGPPSVYYEDFGFFMREQNTVSITLKGADTATPVSFGMQVVFADGSEQLIQSSKDWSSKVGDKEKPVEALAVYGESPYGEAKISPRAPLEAAWYKKDFELKKEVAAARLYLCGLGYSEPYLNGKKVGDHVLDPGQTDYPNIAHYQAWDVAEHLQAGTNALSVLLGDGWFNNDRMFSKDRHVYGKPGLRAYLDIRYADGTSETVVSDQSWRWKPSGLTLSNLFLGDHIDYRKWHAEWEKPGYPAGWQATQEVAPLSPKLVAQDFPPIRIVREIEPIDTWQIGEKTWIVDLGQNISGWIGMKIDEAADTIIRIRCSEILTEDGKHLDNAPGSFQSCHAAPQHHQIIADGKPHSWRPFFSYHGFRYAEVHGLSSAPKPGQIKGLVVNTDAPVTASFRSSDPLLDRIFQMGIQTHHNNMHSILEDCPHREKCLWGGDLHSSWATGFYTLDSASFYRQQVNLFYTPPFDKRGIPGRIGVGSRHTDLTLDFTWSVSPLFLAWRNYQINGDIQTVETHYDVMLTFLRFTEGDSTKLMPNIHRYGDHAAPIGIDRVPADSQLIAGLNFFAAAKRFAVFAEVLGKTEDAAWSRDLAERIRKSIIENYYDPETRTFGNGTHDSLALAFDVFPEDEQSALAATLAQTYQDNGKKFDGGFMSYFIYPELTEHGHVDLALEMLRNPDYPGIAQSIRDYDATTIFERYRSDNRKRQLNHSLDHHAMNHPTAWMLNYLAGIRIHPEVPGSRKLLLQPYFPETLDWVDAEKETPYGTVKSAWKKQGSQVAWKIAIPANSVAAVKLPPLSEGVTIQGQTTHEASFELSSGHYTIQFTIPD
ncbi:family 78 glycoside hydrolase catalytic domain [Pelagicoccus sp. SDUM812005]|uniref:family 78 glycoside hydrolase catalytic domain n=1 Tax=Pelagicoccus sp. SDUM812005 TaxID=3041257 RepID=UPI0028108A59|nr:family 78 glycoside hydrolase catalytic domain [Pelagicoccus sp. SDUM812005]MDQ8183138.1 family 78 glycoside hydrolase catalytic domain [Pelagicoccus sp. SDUM812005]